METFNSDTVIYLLGLASMWGSLQARLKALEKKVELHNNAVERLTVVERQVAVQAQQISEAHERLCEWQMMY
ncbi:MAG: hypothetical protein IJF62_00820 [Firmicutes bacterium]|nr:hypothetical protein [Bacillota bacterium]MBQ3112008.1 hypothetical protein [Bacillota bacterium]MBQ6842507.1 hypothetical protein [Bacillota bacterium]MBR6823632.1 hypothetical protein [Bacillota bacterium]MBR7113931.1 hypothetical protein [Bacillota bacterium]